MLDDCLPVMKQESRLLSKGQTFDFYFCTRW